MAIANKRARTKTRDTRGRKRCPHCGNLVPARWFVKHLTEQHGAKQGAGVPKLGLTQRRRKLTCPHCGKTFRKLSGLSSHVHYLHPNQPTPGQRGEPPQSTTNGVVGPAPGAKKRAGREVGKKKVKCPHCGQTFVGNHRLATHLQHRHTNITVATISSSDGAVSKTAVAHAPILAVSGGVDQHLRTALDQLTQRLRNIE